MQSCPGLSCSSVLWGSYIFPAGPHDVCCHCVTTHSGELKPMAWVEGRASLLLWADQTTCLTVGSEWSYPSAVISQEETHILGPSCLAALRAAKAIGCSAPRRRDRATDTLWKSPCCPIGPGRPLAALLLYIWLWTVTSAFAPAGRRELAEALGLRGHEGSSLGLGARHPSLHCQGGPHW